MQYFPELSVQTQQGIKLQHAKLCKTSACCSTSSTTVCRSPELKSLLDGDSAFPSSPFDSKDVLASLQQLGLKTTASFQTLLESARHIVQLTGSQQAAAVQK